jgi:hypothetical protein
MALTLTFVAVNIGIMLLLQTLYTILDRLLISDLALVPGPRLAALTSWYECYYDVFKPGQYVFRIKEMHEQFGKFRISNASRFL